MIMHCFHQIGHGKSILCKLSKVKIPFCNQDSFLVYSFGFSACGKNEGQLPLSISSFKNEFAVFFRSSLKDNYKGLNCRYKVIPELLATTLEPQSSTPSSVNHNGDGNK